MSAVGETGTDLRESISGLCCAVSLEVMKAAVVLPCGHSFDETTVTDLQNRGDKHCPQCRAAFENSTPNWALRSAIDGLPKALQQQEAPAENVEQQTRVKELEEMVARLQAAEDARVQQQTTMEELRAQASQTPVPMPIFDPEKRIWV